MEMSMEIRTSLEELNNLQSILRDITNIKVLYHQDQIHMANSAISKMQDLADVAYVMVNKWIQDQ